MNWSLPSRPLELLLCDADGNLFPSEEPAFDASVDVTNRLMEAIGSPRRFEANELRLATTGKNFRSTAAELAASAGRPLSPDHLEQWVATEKHEVSRHLAAGLAPDPLVREPLGRLGRRYALAAVSSSAAERLAACFRATGLDDLIPPERRFSAEDSLPVPRSKPDPAIYVHALEALAASPERALAVEDSVPGVQSAVRAGVATVGNVMFVPDGEREERTSALIAAGAAGVVASWHELEEALAHDSVLAAAR
jgi:HAD superfamily hydrolase (TIGR01509 family)